MKTIRISLIIGILMFTPLWLDAEDKAAEEKQPAPQEQKTKADSAHTATVAEAKMGGQYLYMRLQEEGKETWIATYPAFLGGNASPGDIVQYRGGVEMTNFTSKSLEQTFDRILFITRIQKVNASKLKQFDAVPADKVHSPYTAQEAPKSVQAPAPGELKKTEQGKSIEEIFAALGNLKDTQVVVTARVMKVNTKILGKNWLTLQDGTGTAPEDRLTATTLEMANVGDDVTIKGIIKTDVNLGGGYRYKVLLEEATIVK